VDAGIVAGFVPKDVAAERSGLEREQEAREQVRASRAALALTAACALAVLTCDPAAATGTDERPSIRAKISGVRGANGWYRSDVSVDWVVSDPDGIRDSDGCGPRVLRGDTPGRTISCTATTNRYPSFSRTVKVTVKIDKTAPVLGDVSVSPGAGLNDLRWRSTSSTDVVVVQRSRRAARTAAPETVFQGAAASFADTGIVDGAEYVYTLRAYDEAGNASAPVHVRALPKVLLLRRLPYVPRVAAAPILRWKPDRRASYYHVQLFHRGRRVLAAWPLRPELELPATWSWGGRRHRLDAGPYRWYVWVGLGRRGAARYARLGTAAFTVVRSVG
jgi:hypothetical protein